MRPGFFAICLFAAGTAGMLRAAGDEPAPRPELAAAMAAKANALFPQVALEHAARVGQAVVPPEALSLPKPSYPLLDRVIEKQGEVWVGFVVGPEGTVTDAKALSDGDPRMAKAAVAGVRRWRFKPGLVNGRAEEFLVTILVRFQLPRDSLKG